MLRSFLLSRLRHNDCRSLGQLGLRGACWTTSRGYASPSSSQDDTLSNNVDHPSYKRRHLYLVLDDWTKGFSIHKLDLHNDNGSGRPLPPPVHRQEKNRGHWNFAAIGSKIMAAGQLGGPDDDGITLTYDTKTAAVSAVSPLPALLLRDPWTLVAAMGNGLYVFEPSTEDDIRRNLDAEVDVVGNGMHRLDAEGRWTWSSLPAMLPFSAGGIESSVVHPAEEGGGDRGTLFLSVGRWDHKRDRYGHLVYTGRGGQDFSRTSETFSYAGGGQWRSHGEWDLPFYGEGHYDDELEAWVGLNKKHTYSHWGHTSTTDGYLCSSDVAFPEESTAQPPASKICGERLFDPADDRHVGASLVYMGDSTYCLVEVKALEISEKNQVGNKSAIHLAIFRLKYGKSGEIRITKRRPDRSYLFSRFEENDKVKAFWM